LKRPRLGFEIEEGAPGPEITVDIREGRAVLGEVAVKGGGETLESDMESAVKEVEGFVGKGRVKSKVFLLQFVACY
jgi:hypothetical protein